jgi:anti-anti-sigma regulatory factor
MIPYADISTQPLALERATSQPALVDLPGSVSQVIVGRGGLLRIVTAPSPLLLRLEGEADRSNRGLLADTVHAMTRPGHQDLHVDLSGLNFIDIGGLLLLQQAEQNLIRQGRRLWMYEVPPVARRVMRLIDWEMPTGEPA